MFKYKTEEELSKMTQAERDQYGVDKRAHEAELLTKAIKEATDKLKTELTEAQKEEVKSQVELLKGKDGISKEEFEEVKETLNQLKEAGANGQAGDSFLTQLEKALTEALPTLKAMREDEASKGKELVIEVKAAVNMSTTSVANASGVNAPANYVYQQVTDYATDVRADAYILNFIDNGTTNKAALPYMDKLPTEGTMAITAEGALKPLISVTFELRYSQAVKIAGRTKLSEEALDDIPGIMSIIRGELMYEHDIAEENAVHAKIAAIAPAFVAGGMAASTTEPTNYDAIRAAIYAVKIQSKGRYVPNAVLVASADVYNMGATKDANNQYVFPPFVMPDGSKISGVTVVEVNADTDVPEGTFIVGDFKKLKRRVYKGFTVRIGQGIVGSATAANIQSDFETNMYTLIGESRLHLYIYKNEEVAFVKSTFAAVKTAIEAA